MPVGARARPEIVAVDDERFFGRLARFVNDSDAALLAERRIGQDHVVFAVFSGQRVLHQNGNIVFQRSAAVSAVAPFSRRRDACATLSDAVQKEVHATKPGHTVDQLDAEQRPALKPFLLGTVERVMFGDEIMRREQETASPTRGVTNRVARCRLHRVHDGGDERAWCEVLARAAFHVLGVLLQQALIGVPLHVGGKAGPLFLVNQVHDEPAQLGRVLDFILRLAKNDAEEAVPLP